MTPAHPFNLLQYLLLCLILLNFAARLRYPEWAAPSGAVTMALLGLSMLTHAWRAKVGTGEWSRPFLLVSAALLSLAAARLVP